jgi:hypothetical protein
MQLSTFEAYQPMPTLGKLGQRLLGGLPSQKGTHFRPNTFHSETA